MFERILLPLDGSEIAETALPYGEELAKGLGSELILYHVRGHEHLQEYEHIHQMYLARLAETAEHNIKSDTHTGAEVKVTIKVEAGEPTVNICDFVGKNDVSLIIMAGVSASGLKIGKGLGSVTDYVCRTVAIPVMLIRPQNIKQNEEKQRLINRLLLPLDGSDLSKLALPITEEIAANLKVRVTLFQMANIIRPVYDVTGTGSYINYTELNEDEKKRVIAEMIALETELKEKDLDVTNIVTSGFDAADEIIKAVEKVNADLVVMSTHGRSGIGRWVFGNVAEKVLRHGDTPLLLVHARAG